MSVLNQDLEKTYIVYDVGSTDESRLVISNYLDQITPIFVESDLGPSDGLNRSLASLDSEIFYYLNADDIVLPGAFNFASEYFRNHPECDVLHGALQIINREGEVTRTLPPIDFSLKGYALGVSVVYQQSTFFRRSCLQNVRFNLENRTCWDGELIVDLALAGYEIHRTNTILGQFRIYSESITGSGRFVQQIRKDHARIVRKILGRDLRKSEILLGKLFRITKALRRRFFPTSQVKEIAT
jgi:glycosyltransferase involved in cell wall biosynthesis